MPGQEAHGDNLGKLFYLYNNAMLSVLIRIASELAVKKAFSYVSYKCHFDYACYFGIQVYQNF